MTITLSQGHTWPFRLYTSVKCWLVLPLPLHLDAGLLSILICRYLSSCFSSQQRACSSWFLSSLDNAKLLWVGFRFYAWVLPQARDLSLGKRHIWLQHSATLPKPVTDPCNKWILTNLIVGTLISILIALSHAVLWSCVEFVLIPSAELGCMHACIYSVYGHWSSTMCQTLF